MTMSWYPAIQECCSYWSDAPMLQQTFDALEKNFNDGNDACIDCAKSIIEVVCRVIIDELDDPASPLKPKEESPDFGKWVSTAVRILKLGDVRHGSFQKLISQHHKLTTTLGTLRNDSGPVSHGKDGFIERLSLYHQRAAVLSADAIVAFLHQAYLEAEPNIAKTREPYDRFSKQNNLIDEWCVFISHEIDEDNGLLAIEVRLPNDAGPLFIETSPSQFLFHLDRDGYIEALNASRSAEMLESSTEDREAV
jgi:hypothetical protein